MSQTFTIPTKFTATETVTPVVNGMAKNILSATDKANAGIARQQALFKKLTPSLGAAAKNLLSYASAGTLLAGAAFSGKAVMDYETAIQSLSAVTGVYGDQLTVFKSDIRSLANESKKSATDVAGAFETIGSAMSQYLTDPKALREISGAGITLSKASRMELVPTLENLTSIMNQFDLKASQAADTVNRLTAGEIVGALRTSQVAEALQEFGAGAYAANVTLSESVALVEALAKQMKQDKIGVGARNILTVLDSAKGLDKKARKDLRSSGVDLGFLMNKSKSLSERLHELSKISGDATKITSVFGKENKTAAQVIFNQLGTYDAYLAKIKVTNEAEKQAATNSDTLAVAVDELKNAWVNFIATSDKAGAGLNTLKNGAKFLANNIDEIVSVGITALKFFALWKAAIIAQQVVTTGFSIAMGINNALKLQSIALLEGNVIATRASIIAEKAMAASIAISTGNWAALNAVMMANPIGLIVVGLAALAGATYYAYQKTKELREEYQKSIALKHEDVIKNESIAVQKLADHYRYLGLSIKEANALAIRTEKVNIDTKRQELAAQITALKSKTEGKKFVSSSPLAMLYNSAVSNNTDNQKLNELQSQDAVLATRGRQNTQMARDYMDADLLDQKDLGKTFGSKKSTSPSSNNFGDLNYMASKKSEAPIMQDPGYRPSDSDKILMSAAKSLKEAADKLNQNSDKKISIEIKGNNYNGGSNVTTSNSY